MIGGGPAGATAAIQSARLGARTLLVEKNAMLGGTTTAAAIDIPGLFHAWGRQVIAGIGWELVERAVDIAGDSLPDFTDYSQRANRLSVQLRREIYATLLDEAVLDAGATLWFHTMVGAVDRDDTGWQLTLCGKEGLFVAHSRILIDCTGDANVVALAGFERERNVDRQPATYSASFSGYDAATLDYDALEEARTAAVEAGELHPTDLRVHDDGIRGFLRYRGRNSMHIPGIDGSTSQGRTRAEIEGRRGLLRIFSFLRRQPGLEGLAIDYFAAECGIRETYTIKGKERITVDDYISGRLWDDAVCYSFYPIDIHRPSGHGIDYRTLAKDTYPTIPRGALLPQGSTGLIAAGRCAAGDQEANSAYRVQASCMAMGQAAGVMAALAAASGVDPEMVPLADIHRTLRAHGAIVPDDVTGTTLGRLAGAAGR